MVHEPPSSNPLDVDLMSTLPLHGRVKTLLTNCTSSSGSASGQRRKSFISASVPGIYPATLQFLDLLRVMKDRKRLRKVRDAESPAAHFAGVQ